MSSETPPSLPRTGGCLCGAVRYLVTGPMRQIVTCHCEQCRRTTGHFMAATAARREHVSLTDAHGLRWYRSSQCASRGFCEVCGSTLFWQGPDDGYLAIAAGSVDGPTGLAIAAQIFVDHKGDYYALDEDLPTFPEGGCTITSPIG